MSYLCDGRKPEDLAVPPADIFVKNHYKHFPIEDISVDRLNKIISLNSLG